MSALWESRSSTSATTLGRKSSLRKRVMDLIVLTLRRLIYMMTWRLTAQRVTAILKRWLCPTNTSISSSTRTVMPDQIMKDLYAIRACLLNLKENLSSKMILTTKKNRREVWVRISPVIPRAPKEFQDTIGQLSCMSTERKRLSSELESSRSSKDFIRTCNKMVLMMRRTSTLRCRLTWTKLSPQLDPVASSNNSSNLRPKDLKTQCSSRTSI